MVVTWTFTDNHGTTSNIITSSNANITAPDYSGRITLFRATGSLELRGLTIGDTGEYTVTVIPTGAGHQKGYLTINSTELMEFSGPVTLRCFSSGSSLTFQWLNGSSVVTASDRVQLTDGGSALTIVNVTRYDQGPFRCHVSNAHSNGTSDAVDLLIILGPEDIKLTVFPLKEYHDQGSDVILTCSVVSRPPAQFLWYLNGNPSVHKTPELRLMNVQLSQRGNYTCEAFNNRTMKTQTSQPVILETLTLRTLLITPNATDLSEFGSVSFTCSSSGSSRSFRWINRTSEITAGDRVQLMDDGSRLVIINVSRYDAGPFLCHVFNNFSNSTSDAVKLSINYFSPCDCVPAAGFAAIVTVGICLLLTALIGLVVYCVRRNKR
uniref:Carcinoembryonic antigen-related cell adhesion molecule 5-like n=1 Tax=Cynoglossus semilaevis TaxID=244447 RepID=A0A3P8VTP5_CYNSE